jgi:hypothetical protein
MTADLIARLRSGALMPFDLDRAADALAGRVRVKPLVWERLGGGNYRAKAPLFGNIRIEGWSSGKWNVAWSVPGFCDTFTDGDFPTLEAAQAAAQADFADRIMAAIVVVA